VGFVERSDDSRANERVAGDSDKKKERIFRIGCGYPFCGKDSRKKHLPLMARNVFALNEDVKF
jgi:hypothetical protein